MDQQIGGALGIAVIAAVYATATVPGDLAAGLPIAFMVAAVIALSASIIGLWTIRRLKGGQFTSDAIRPLSEVCNP